MPTYSPLTFSCLVSSHARKQEVADFCQMMTRDVQCEQETDSDLSTALLSRAVCFSGYVWKQVWVSLFIISSSFLPISLLESWHLCLAGDLCMLKESGCYVSFSATCRQIKILVKEKATVYNFCSILTWEKSWNQVLNFIQTRSFKQKIRVLTRRLPSSFLSRPLLGIVRVWFIINFWRVGRCGQGWCFLTRL